MITRQERLGWRHSFFCPRPPEPLLADRGWEAWRTAGADRAPPLRNQKFVDSPVEGNGFELPVPRQIGMISSTRRSAILFFEEGGSVIRSQPVVFFASPRSTIAKPDVSPR